MRRSMWLTRTWTLTSVLLALGGWSCGGDTEENPPPLSGTAMKITGVVSGSGGGGVSALSGVDVVAHVDRNRNGDVDANESVRVVSGDDGGYSIAIPVETAETVVLRFALDGYAPLFRSLASAPGSSAVLNVALLETEDLECNAGRCSIPGGALSVSDLPEGVSGLGRVFNPVAEVEAFPGDFSDSEGNLLVSGVFSLVELTGPSGETMSELATEATLRMQMPRDTWALVTDIEPGTDRIDVPMYYFDEVSGEWVREGSGFLEDENGEPIPEADLGSIRSGSYAGTVVACSKVKHFSYWNVDWPIDTHACLKGVVKDAQGQPARGATVHVSGLSYSGTSQPQTTAEDGSFCLEVMRSETAGEDVDQDGTPGETQRVSVRVSHEGKLYDFGEIEVTTAQGSCGEGGCQDLGELILSADRELTATFCTYTGTVRDQRGRPIEGASVVLYPDSSLPSDSWSDLCFGGSEPLCDFAVSSDANGNFSIRSLVLDLIYYYASVSRTTAEGELFLFADGLVRGCPGTPLNITLSQGWVSATLSVTISGDEISWEPPMRVQYLTVTNAAGDAKWALFSEDQALGLPNPVTYGVVPDGALQYFPIDASPAAFASGDVVTLTVYGTTSEGYTLYGYGSATKP